MKNRFVSIHVCVSDFSIPGPLYVPPLVQLFRMCRRLFWVAVTSGVLLRKGMQVLFT